MQNLGVTLYRALRMIPMVLIMGIIFFLSHQSGDSLYVPPIPGFDKILHFGVYFVLGGAVIYGLYSGGTLRAPLTICLITIVICTFYGVSDEFHQSFIPGRFVSFADLVTDFFGALAACCLWVLLSIRRKNSSKCWVHNRG